MGEKTYTKVCVDCGTQFETAKKLVRLCDECRANKVKERNEKNFKQYKSVKTTKKKENKKKAPSLIEYMLLVEQYNKKHGTMHTYGKFQELIQAGKIKL